MKVARQIRDEQENSFDNPGRISRLVRLHYIIFNGDGLAAGQ